MIMRLIKWFLSGEVIFAGFLFSSVFKGLFDIKVDLTLVFMVLSVINGVTRIIVDKNILRMSIFPMLNYILISTIMLVSILYTPSELYAQEKLLKFLFMTGWSFVGVFILIKDKNSLRTFMKGLLFFGVVTSLLVFYDYIVTSNSIGRIGVGDDDNNVLGLGRLAGITAIILTVMYFFNKTKIRSKVIAGAMLGISIIVLMITGSRMPFIAFLVSLFLVLIMYMRFKKRDIVISKRLLAIIPAIPFLGVGIFIFYYQGYFNPMLNRISILFEAGGGASVSTRNTIHDSAIAFFKDAPFLGQGIGSFPIIYKNADIEAHPHNIFLEALAELGIIGCLGIVFLLIGSFFVIHKSRKNSINNLQIIVVSILVFLFLNSMVSSDLNGNRWLFTFIALSYMLPLYADKSHDFENNVDDKENELKRRLVLI